MAMPQCCYLAKGAKRPSHTTILLTSSINQVPYILAATVLKATNLTSPEIRCVLQYVCRS